MSSRYDVLMRFVTDRVTQVDANPDCGIDLPTLWIENDTCDVKLVSCLMVCYCSAQRPKGMSDVSSTGFWWTRWQGMRAVSEKDLCTKEKPKSEKKCRVVGQTQWANGGQSGGQRAQWQWENWNWRMLRREEKIETKGGQGKKKKNPSWGLVYDRMRWAALRHDRPWQSTPYAD